MNRGTHDDPGVTGIDHPARLHPPAVVRRIAAELERHGHETWCVGGAVRDAILGIQHLDWDLATAATPQEVRRIFRRTVPVGIEFGTVGVLDEHGQLHEVTTFRRDVRTDGRHAEVEFGASLDEDLARRDLTINAIAYSPSRRVLHDPFRGRDDLARRVVRAVGDPAARMREDRLRALRAIRFAARFGFTIEPVTWAAIVESAPYLDRLSAERVKQELDKTAEQVARAGGALRLWRDAGALRVLVPDVGDLSEETIAALDALPRARGRRGAERRVVWYATLLGDVPARQLAPVLKGLRFSNAEGRAVTRLVELWQSLGGEIGEALVHGDPDNATVRRWVSRAGRTDVGAFLRVAAARWCARRTAGGKEGDEVRDQMRDQARDEARDQARGEARDEARDEALEAAPSPASVRRLYRRALAAAWRDPVALADLAVGGDDLRRAGIPPGPRMARILHGLLDAVLEDPSRNRVDVLLERAGVLAADLADGEEQRAAGGAEGARHESAHRGSARHESGRDESGRDESRRDESRRDERGER